MASSVGPDALQGACPSPFLQAEKFPSTGGLISGRLCIPVDFANATCCIPCPVTDWTYSDGFEKRTEIANWINVAAAVATAFMLLSFACLAVKWTHRHYLGICLAIGILFMELAFIIPLGSKPDQCFNEITPNDMRSDLTCAFSGAFLLFGGWAVVIWVFWRALLLHLQICWEVIPGPKFFYIALTIGWGIPAAGLALVLSLTGVSYRFGNVCHINHDNGLADFWGPMLAFAALALVLQFITAGYCIHVYIKSLLNDGGNSSFSSHLPSSHGASSLRTARQTYRRVRRVVQTQWRGAMIVLVIIYEVVFFSVVFVSLDNSAQITPALIEKAEPWIECLISTRGDKQACLAKAAPFVASENVVLAVLIFLGMSGFWYLLFLGRWSMVLGWRDLFKRKMLSARGEFISVDARRAHTDLRTYEMIDSTKSTLGPKIAAPHPVVLSPERYGPQSAVLPDFGAQGEHFGRITIQRDHRASPTSIYSSPMTSIGRSQITADWTHHTHDQSHDTYSQDYAR